MSQLTVVIPVWDNYCEQIVPCVEDILAQDAAAEILVIDNASSVRLPVLPARVRTLRLSERVSVGAARNASLPHVHSRYVLFADADDRLLPGAISHLVEILDADARRVAAVGRQIRWSPRSGERVALERAPRPIVHRIAPFRHLLALCTLRFNIFPIVGCAALRTDAVRASGGFGDGNVGEDWELCAALAWRGPIAFSRRSTRLYAVGEGSLWHRQHERATFEAQYARFRRRLDADPAVPSWTRPLRAVFARLQRRDLDRMFRHGTYHPGAEFSSGSDRQPHPGLGPSAKAR